MKRITRINADLDTRDIDEVIRCLKTFKKYHFVKNLVIKDSPSGNGFHIQAWHIGKGVKKDKLLKIRKKAGDDKIRIMLDGKSGRQIGVLFSEKTKKSSSCCLFFCKW